MTGQYLHHVWQVLLELSPWLLGGLLVAGLLHGLLPHDFIWRHLGRNRFASVLKAVALGVPMPLCSCGVIPAALGIKKQGASDGAAVGFLISTPQTGVDSIFVSGAFLGWPFALFKVFSALVTGIVGGAVTQVSARGLEKRGDEAPTRPEKQPGLMAMLSYAVNDLLHMIWIWILVGILVSAAISTWVPQEYFVGTALGGPMAPLLVLLISLPLYVCATSSVPIAASLVAAGMPTGAALVFLMAGPASNVATLGAVFRGFGARVLAIYLATITIGSLGFAYAFDFVLRTEGAPVQNHEHQHNWFSVLSAMVLLGLMVWFFLRDIRRWLRKRQISKSGDNLKITVTGMTCGGCVDRVQTVLQQQPGVATAAVDLKTGSAMIQGHRLDLDRLQGAIREAGFGIDRR